MGIFNKIDSVMRIKEAIRDRRAVRNVAHELNKENKVDRKKEALVNSATNELMNLYSAVKVQAEESRIELDGMRIAPKTPKNRRVINTYQDPKILMEVIKETPLFAQDFEVRTTQGKRGEQQYIIREKKVDPNHLR